MAYLSWDTSAVAEQLDALDLGQYSSKFEQHDITGAVLPLLRDEHLKELGMKIIGHRLRLLKWIRGLETGDAPTSNRNRSKPPRTAQPDPPRAPSSGSDEYAAPPNSAGPHGGSSSGGGGQAGGGPSTASNWEQKRRQMMLKKMQADKGGGGNSQNQQNQQKQQNYQKKQQNTPPEEDYPSGRSSGRLISQDVIDEAPKMAKKTPQQQQWQNQIQKQQQQQQQRRQPSRNAYEDDDENEDDSDDGYKPPPPPPKRPAQRKPMSSAPPPPADEDDGDDDRVECAYCHRKFASDRVAKHEEVCARMSTKKKRVFDAQKMRLKGTEAAQYATKAQKQPESKKPSKFKQEHQKLVEALRAARKIQAYEKAKEEGKAVGPPPELPKYEIEDDDRTPCPYCGRKFGGDAAQKHIAVCERMNGNKGRMNMGGANRRGGRR